MRYILLPVKDLTFAKQRLAEVMSQTARTRLALAMMEYTFSVVSRVKSVDGIAVVTSYATAIELAEQHGFEVIRESAQISESASVDLGSGELESRGATAVLRLPIDLPFLSAEDIEEVFSRDRAQRGVVIVPSRDGTGTNAILRRPPTLFPSHFGMGSLAKHLAEAEAAGAAVELIRSERIGLDVDEPDDITEVLRRKDSSPIRELLAAMHPLGS
jgi:2-phospho-L-lactate/phosphoenolpyruvate guanylyltransferase